MLSTGFAFGFRVDGPAALTLAERLLGGGASSDDPLSACGNAPDRDAFARFDAGALSASDPSPSPSFVACARRGGTGFSTAVGGSAGSSRAVWPSVRASDVVVSDDVASGSDSPTSIVRTPSMTVSLGFEGATGASGAIAPLASLADSPLPASHAASRSSVSHDGRMSDARRSASSALIDVGLFADPVALSVVELMERWPTHVRRASRRYHPRNRRANGGLALASRFVDVSAGPCEAPKDVMRFGFQPFAWLSLATLGCSAESTQPVGASAAEPAFALAESMRSESMVLPVRERVVAVADEAAARAAHANTSVDASRGYDAAIGLRERLFRIEGREADGREAAELLATVGERQRGTEAGCVAELRRALLLGELARSATVTYREVFLAKRSYAALEGAAHASACLADAERTLLALAAFAPEGDDRAQLESQADRAASRSTPPTTPAGSAASRTTPPETPEVDDELVVVPTDVAVPTLPVKIAKIEPYGAENSGRVVIELSEPTPYTVGELAADATHAKDDRIFVDLPTASLRGVAKSVDVGGAIRRVRVGAQGQGARIVLDLASKLRRRVFYLPAPFRIVIDVSEPRARAAQRKQGEPRDVRRVVLDPGHGGVDAGAVGPTGLREKDVVLDIAHRAAPVLAHELGIETMLTRDKDVLVPLDERAARANAFHADLFVSIHCNASESGEARGIEVFVLDPSKDATRATSRVAALENGWLGKKALDASSLDAEMARILQRLGSGETSAASRVLGELLARSSMASLTPRYPDLVDHGLKSAAFTVLAGAEMPAVLFETSFISNPEDESRLGKAGYRQKIADAIVNAVRAYRDGR